MSVAVAAVVTVDDEADEDGDKAVDTILLYHSTMFFCLLRRFLTTSNQEGGIIGAFVIKNDIQYLREMILYETSDCGVLVFVDVRVENEWWLSEFLLYTSSLIGGFSPKEILFASYFQKGSWKIKGRDRKQIDRHEDVRLLFSKRKLQIIINLIIIK